MKLVGTLRYKYTTTKKQWQGAGYFKVLIGGNTNHDFNFDNPYEM